MARRGGRQGVVLLGTTAAGAAKVAHLTNWKLSYKTTKIDVTAFGDTNKVVVPDLASITGSFTGFWDDTEDKPFNIAMSAGGGWFYGYPDQTNSPSYYCYGPIYSDIDIDVPVSGAVGITGTFEAAGAWYINL